MGMYIILSRFSPEALSDPGDFPKLAEKVSAKIKSDCPQVRWQSSYATLGSFDAVDLVEAPDVEAVEKASMIIRAYGHAVTQTLPATPWKEFIKNLQT
jgi:uncharacterized protein with GYD domain